MSNSTSEERQRVADDLSRLRHVTYYNEEIVENIKDVIGIASPANTFREPEDVYELLADLIDPTCEMVAVPDNDEFMIRVVSGFVCRKCGFEAIVERNLDGSANMPNYCPNCGARVAGETDE